MRKLCNGVEGGNVLSLPLQSYEPLSSHPDSCNTTKISSNTIDSGLSLESRSDIKVWSVKMPRYLS